MTVRPCTKDWRRWSDNDVRYLRRHRDDGAELIAEALGRTPASVRNKAARLGVSIGYRQLETCPLCGAYPVRPGTRAGSHGMCCTCWERRKAENMRERAAEERAQREYDAAKKRKGRAHGEPYVP